MIGSTAGNAVILRLRLFPGATAPFRLAMIATLCAQFEAFANSDPTATSMPSRHLEFVRRICTLYMQAAARSLTLSMEQPKRIDRHHSLPIGNGVSSGCLRPPSLSLCKVILLLFMVSTPTVRNRCKTDACQQREMTSICCVVVSSPTRLTG
jgi:hypothetical protein